MATPCGYRRRISLRCMLCDGQSKGAGRSRRYAEAHVQTVAATTCPILPILTVGHRSLPEDGLGWQVLAGSLTTPGRRAWDH